MRVSGAVLGSLMVAAASNSAHAFIIRPVFDEPELWTTTQRAVISQAITDWTSRIAFAPPNDQIVRINFQSFPGGTGQGASLAQWSFSVFNVPEFPYSPVISHQILVNSDVLDRMWISLDAPSPGDGYDMLTIIRHELGHALGFATRVYFVPSPGIDKWTSHIDENNIFDPDGLHVPMLADGAHVNLPSDLMYFSLNAGVRKDISGRDVEMLTLAYGYTAIPEPSSLLLLAAGAAALLKRSPTRRR